MSEKWPFDDHENLAVFTLKRVVGGESPILRVCHDEDGGWQFLDGGEVAVEEASLVSLRSITEVDPSVLELADLPFGWVTSRAKPGDPWRRAPIVTEEDRERKVVSNMEEFGHPEVILFGLDLGVMHQIINLIGEEVKQGRPFSDGESVSGLLEGYDVRFLNVARRHSRDHFGDALWFYEGDDSPVLQCLWPDRQGRFPTGPDFPDPLRARQPLLAQ